jgi:hypothetical protein
MWLIINNIVTTMMIQYNSIDYVTQKTEEDEKVVDMTTQLSRISLKKKTKPKLVSIHEDRSMDYSQKTCKELIAICKEKNIKGYSRKKQQELIEMILTPEMTSSKIELPIMTIVEDLELLKHVLLNKDAQRGLIALYSQSQTECTRNGVCGMEVGMSREKDQGAVLKLFLGDKINLEIDNTLPEDYVIGTEKISAKHSGSKVGSPVKAKWTSADLSVKEAIESMIHAPDSYYPHLLITYLDTKNNKITIICILSEDNKNIIKTLQEGAFTVPKGNSRGIEYSKKAMKELLKKIYFKIEISNADLKSGINPIERRIQLLKNMGINL